MIDEDSMLFAFEIITKDKKKYQLPPLEDGPEDWYVILKVIDLSEKNQKYISEKMVDISKQDIFWTVHDGVIYHYCKKINQLFAYNKKLNTVKSPLVDSFNKVAAYGAGASLCYLQFHKTLPFAIIGISVKNDTSFILPYHHIAILKDGKCKFVPFFLGRTALNIDDFYFSPDGNWLVFQYSSEYQGSPHYYFMKINPENPVFLEQPRYLGKTSAKHGRGITTAWSTNPTCFVVSDGTFLYRWDMEKADKGKLQNSNY